MKAAWSKIWQLQALKTYRSIPPRMNGVYLFKIEVEKTPYFLAAHGVKIDFMVGYFTWSTDFCVLFAMFLIAFYIHFRLQDFD